MTQIGEAVPDFSLLATGDKTLSLNDFKGKKVILYFYPKDSTPGCTTQGCNFRDLKQEFADVNAVILGVSRDNLRSHERFKERQGFNFDLLSDTEEKLCGLFDVIKEKSMFGKKVRGIVRSTFIIDEHGVLIKEWRKVKVNGHVDEVLHYLRERSSK